MRHGLIIVVASLLGGLAAPGVAQKLGGDTIVVMSESSPGRGTVAQVRTVVATVESIDVTSRQVTLRGPKGNPFPLSVGPEVRNLQQVKVGDQVVVRYVESLSLELKKGGQALRSSTEAVTGARTPAGERPGGVVAEEVKVTADVIAVNTETGMVTLRGPKRVVDLHVVDPEQLKLIKIGDQVDAVYTQALALSVEPARGAGK